MPWLRDRADSGEKHGSSPQPQAGSHDFICVGYGDGDDDGVGKLGRVRHSIRNSHEGDFLTYHDAAAAGTIQGVTCLELQRVAGGRFTGRFAVAMLAAPEPSPCLLAPQAPRKLHLQKIAEKSHDLRYPVRKSLPSSASLGSATDSRYSASFRLASSVGTVPRGYYRHPRGETVSITTVLKCRPLISNHPCPSIIHISATAVSRPRA